MSAKLINLLTAIAVITVNALANILPINGISTGQVSALYENYFTPAGFTFSIWSVIYLGALVFVSVQFFSKSPYPSRIVWLFVLNGLANIGWIFAWHYQQFFMTLLLMLVILVTLILINQRITGGPWWVLFPFRIYLGWICVATVANMAVVLTYGGWSALGFSGETWGIIMVIVAVILGLLLLWRTGWLLSALAIAWGIWGIHQKQIQLEQAANYRMVCLLAIAVLVTVFLFKGTSKS